MNIRELALAVLGQTELVEPTATNAENYFTYDGSFTTAPCTQVKPLASTPEPQTPRSSHRALSPPPPSSFPPSIHPQPSVCLRVGRLGKPVLWVIWVLWVLGAL